MYSHKDYVIKKEIMNTCARYIFILWLRVTKIRLCTHFPFLKYSSDITN